MKRNIPPHAPLFIGLDVGSTTVKAVVMDGAGRILWKDYRRHLAKQPETVLAFLSEIERRFPSRGFKVYTTGNGGRTLAPLVGGTQVQEVNAVTCTVEKRHPEAGSAVELGGQDAKIILWKADKHGVKSTRSFMNDKCAGGTGATLDKIFTKIGISIDAVCNLTGEDTAIHHIAAKCGVFAETDVVGLIKSGVREEEIAVSLMDAVVKQNIEVLLHGNVLAPDVLLLGGPHCYYRAFETLWRRRIPEIWKLHRFEPPDRPLEELIYVPKDAKYFAATGAVYFGRASGAHLHAPSDTGRRYLGTDPLVHYIEEGKAHQLSVSSDAKPGLVDSKAEQTAFEARFAMPAFSPPPVKKGATVPCRLGVDGGSTSTKLVLIDEEGTLLYKDYTLSKGNPIADVRTMLAAMNRYQRREGITFEILSAGVTGYAGDILKPAFGFDLSIVETVAHLKAARRFYGDVDVICDVGGQDIKVLFMKHNRVTDIKLNTQCSAGNGYFLQNMAEQFGIPMEQFAEAAFSVRKAPSFNYGCAVFMEQDKVNFQQLGWTKEEIMAGLAHVLPLNIWNYVVQESDLARLGSRFLLQGGTQKNLAAVKAQVDFIESKVPGAEVMVHRYADIAGAVGAALESTEQSAPSASSDFIGLDAGEQVSYTATNDASTVCTFCANRCKRTFIDIAVPGRGPVRHITGYGCDKGTVESAEEIRAMRRAESERAESCPDLTVEAAKRAFAQYDIEPLPPHFADRPERKTRQEMTVGMPRLLNMYLYAPFFSAYFRALGIGRTVFSDFTSERLWSEGNQWGATDPCFPAKVAPAHVYQLLKRDDVTHICFPMITHLETPVTGSLGENACVIQMGTPEAVHAAFTKERDHFLDNSKTYLKPLVRFDRPAELRARLLEAFEAPLRVAPDENEWAVAQGFRAVASFFADLRARGAALINRLVVEDRIGLLLIGHPYHNDPGLNHGIPAAFAARGFPVLPTEALPVSAEFLAPLFPEGTGARFQVADVWPRGFNRNTNVKVWAAKVASRHPNLAVIDMSSFKCGHDAPAYSYIDNILDASKTPHFLFHDLDQNRPSSTLKIRVESIDYFLRIEQERLREKIRDLSA